MSRPDNRENLMSLADQLLWGMQQYGVSTELFGATAYVGFNAALEPKVNYFLCDGTADDVQIALALVYVNGLGGGSVFLEEGDYDVTAGLNVPVDVMLHGAGFNTVLLYNAGGNCITITGDNVKIKDLKIVIVAGAGGVGTRPNCIIAETRTNLEIFGVWGIGDNTVADDGSDNRQTGLLLDTITYSRVYGNRFENNPRYSIYLFSGADNTVTGNTCNGNTQHGIVLYQSDGNTITGNTCNGNTQRGIYVGDSCVNNTLTGNTCNGNTTYGINIFSGADNNVVTGNICNGNTERGIVVHSSSGNTVTGNTCNGNTQYGILFSSSADNNVVTGNICNGNTQHGIFIDESDNNTLTGNTCFQNVRAGIIIVASSGNTIVGNTCNENDVDNTGSWDGIGIQDDSDDNLVMCNTCNENDRYGINIKAATEERNWVKNNQLQGNTAGPFNNVGTDTKLETISLYIVTYNNDTNIADGIEIDAGGEWASFVGQLPPHVQQVMKFEIWAVGLAAPGAGNQMCLTMEIEGGADDEALNTHDTGALVGQLSVTENTAVNDIIHWICTDANALALLGGDSVKCVVTHNAAVASDIATDAAFRRVLVHVV